MELSGIISIAGHSGLFKIIARSKAGLIVESIVDKKRVAIQASEKVSSLEDIGIFTADEDERLTKIFDSIFALEKGGETAVDHKADGAALAAYFKKVLPTYDADRVYASNIKKVIEWYNLLHKAELLIPTEVKAEETETTEEGKKASKKAKTETTAKAPKAAATKTATPRVNSKGSGGAKGTTRKSGVA